MSTPQKRVLRRVVGGCAALLLTGAGLVAGVHAVSAATATDESASYTGCLRTSGTNAGRLFAVKAGQDPTRPCTAEEHPLRLSGGDLTSFAAGTGLRNTSPQQNLGITLRGGVGVELAPAYRLPQGCEASGSATWNGTSWVCAPPPRRPREYHVVHSVPNAQGVGNDWATVGAFDVPSGSWELEARVEFIDGDWDDAASLYCRLDATGTTYLDRVHVWLEPGNEDSVTLGGFHTSASGFRVAAVCRDSWSGASETETGLRWQSVRIVARPSEPVVDANP